MARVENLEQEKAMRHRDKFLQMRISSAEHRELKALSERKGQPMVEIVRRALKEVGVLS